MSDEAKLALFFGLVLPLLAVACYAAFEGFPGI